MALQLVGTLGSGGGGTGIGIPTGGTQGQVLAKTSNANYAAGWVNVLQGLNGVTGIWKGSQVQYDAIGAPSASVIYVVTG